MADRQQRLVENRQEGLKKEMKFQSENGAVFGWFVTRIHDYPEPEGTVWLPMDKLPQKGDKLTMPSDGKECVVSAVNKRDGTLVVAG